MKVEIKNESDVMYWGSNVHIGWNQKDKEFLTAGIYLGKDQSGRHMILHCDSDLDLSEYFFEDDVDSPEKVPDDLTGEALIIEITRLDSTPDLDRELDALPIDTPVCIEYTGIRREGLPVFKIFSKEKKRPGEGHDTAMTGAHLKMRYMSELHKVTGID